MSMSLPAEFQGESLHQGVACPSPRTHQTRTDPSAPAIAPSAPPEPVGSVDAGRDLEALARCLGAFQGSAMPLVWIPGGQGSCSPAEHVQPHLARARRATRRLAGLRETSYGAVLLLLAAYVHGGEEARRTSWATTMYLALLPRPMRLPHLLAGSGPDAASLRRAAQHALLSAEERYALADEAQSDGRWLTEDLDEITRAVRELEQHRAEVESGKATKSKRPARAVPVCAASCMLVVDACDRWRGGLVNARMLDARALGRRVGRACRRCTVDRWRIVAGALVPSARAGVREPRAVRGGEGAWALLQSVAEPKR